MDYEKKKSVLESYIPIKDYLVFTGKILNDYVSHKNIIEDAIERIEDITLKNILILKYIDGKSFLEIGEIMHYCEKQICRLHKKAIEMIEIGS